MYETHALYMYRASQWSSLAKERLFYLDLEDDFRGVVAEATAECIEAREDDLRAIKGLNVNFTEFQLDHEPQN